ncbi:MAG: C39 family peptidase [Candidatus Omnitrophica bacterium]|nr:C39 family peptidase [Candidatus Omnitrophota bacterium]
MIRAILILVFLIVSILPSHAVSFSVGGIRLHKDVRAMRDIKREHVVAQSLDVSCGPAGLATLFNFYLDDPTSENEIIADLLNSTPLEKVRARKGFSLLDLKKFAQSRGYKVTGYKMDMKFLRDFKSPVLVPISFKRYKHFVIVRGIVGDRIFLADPASGNVSMKTDKFEAMWMGGVGMVIEKPRAVARRSIPLKITSRDLTIVDHQSVCKIANQMAVRTGIFPGEF